MSDNKLDQRSHEWALITISKKPGMRGVREALRPTRTEHLCYPFPLEAVLPADWPTRKK